MTEKFKVGQRVVAITNGIHAKDKGGRFVYEAGWTGTVKSMSFVIGFVDELTISFDNGVTIDGCNSRSFQALDEYPMDYTTAFKALIDGKMVEDSQGYVLRFDKDTVRFQCRTATGKFGNVTNVPTNEKFREYIAKPKFKHGQFVEYANDTNGWYRIAKVNNDLTYVVTSMPSTFKDGIAYIAAKESELSEVQ